MTASLGYMKVFLYRVMSSRDSLLINVFLSTQHVLQTFVSSTSFITVFELLLFHDYTNIQCMYQFCVSLCHVPACWRKALQQLF